MGLFSFKKFDFCEYLVNYLGYKEMAEYPQGKKFTRSGMEISIHSDSDNNSEVIIDYKGGNVATLKFIPKSKTMMDIMLNQIRLEVDES